MAVLAHVCSAAQQRHVAGSSSSQLDTLPPPAFTGRVRDNMRGNSGCDVCAVAGAVSSVRPIAHGHRLGRLALPGDRHGRAGFLRGGGDPERHPKEVSPGHDDRHLLHHVLRRRNPARCRF